MLGLLPLELANSFDQTIAEFYLIDKDEKLFRRAALKMKNSSMPVIYDAELTQEEKLARKKNNLCTDKSNMGQCCNCDSVEEATRKSI